MGMGYAHNITMGFAHEHNITTGLFQNGRTGGCGHGVGYCLLSFVSRMIYALFNSYFISIYFFNRKLFLKNTCIKKIKQVEL